MERLKVSGFDISPSMRIQMLKVLDRMGKDFLRQPLELKFLLSPILAKNLEEQEQFYELFDKYMEDMRQSLPQLPKPPAWYNRIPSWTYTLLGLLLLAAMGFGLYKLIEKKPLPQVHFSDVLETPFGDTLTLLNQSLNLGPERPMVWSILNNDSTVLFSDTINRNENWSIPINKVGPNPKKTVRLSLLNPIDDSLYFHEAPLVINCAQPPLVEKDLWPDSARVGQPITFRLKVQDDRPYTYVWRVNDDIKFTNLDSLTFTFDFPNQGFYNISATVELPDVEGRCIKTIEHSIRAIDQQEIAPLVAKPLSKIPDASKAYFKPSWWMLLSLLGLLPLWFLYKWWQHRQQQKGQQQPMEEIRQIFDAPDKPPYFVPFRPMTHVIHAGKELYSFANTLRQRQEGLRKKLNVEESLRATIEKGGFPDIKMERSTRPSEYLFLIDDQHRDSIQSRLFEYLVGFLQDKDVYADRYFYKEAPYSIWKQKESEALNLQQLQRLYPYHRFVLMGDAHRLLSQSGTDAEALNKNFTNSLQRWQQRCLLTPMPPRSWTYKESGLHRWLPTYPADVEGIEQAFEALQENTDEESNTLSFNRWQEAHSQIRPSEPDVNYRKWRKPEVLQEYLSQHPQLWQWLSALSVHPNISWELTLAIGHALDTDGDLVTFDHLLLLSRIPWLQQGHFPPKLRLQLLENLDKNIEHIARQTVKTELEAVENLTKNSFVNFELQAGLAVQSFLLDPENKTHQEVIRALTAGNKPAIGKNRFKELDQQIKKFQLAKGQKAEGLGAFLDKAASNQQGDEALSLSNPYTKWLVGTLSIWLLWWAISFGLNGKDQLHQWTFGDSTAVYQEKNELGQWVRVDQPIFLEKSETVFVAKRFLPPDEVAELNNKAVDLVEMIAIKELTSMQWRSATDSIVLLLNQAFESDSSMQIVNNNRTYYQYNNGINWYESFFVSSESHIKVALNFFEKADKLSNNFPDAKHGIGLCYWYQKDKDKAYEQYQLLAPAFFDTLSSPMDSSNLKTLLQKDSFIFSEKNKPQKWTGRVFDLVTQKPLYRVLVTGPNIKVQTEKGGNYQFQFEDNIPPLNQIGLTYQLRGYQNQSQVVTLDASTKLQNVFLKPTSLAADVVADFRVPLNIECCEAPCTLVFQNRSKNAKRFEWDFGDGNSSTDKNLKHTFTEVGNYTVTLTAFAADGTSTNKKVSYEICKKTSSPDSKTVTDSRDGQVYKTVTIGKQTWMSQNMNYKTADSWCYLELPEFCDKVGRLYTWEAANNACPKGWHLPSDEEWKTLLQNYDGEGTESYQQLIEGGASGFTAPFSGLRSDTYEFYGLSNYSYYWNATKGDADDAYYYYLDKSSGKVFRYNYNTSRALSCRCVKDY